MDLLVIIVVAAGAAALATLGVRRDAIAAFLAAALVVFILSYAASVLLYDCYNADCGAETTSRTSAWW